MLTSKIRCCTISFANITIPYSSCCFVCQKNHRTAKRNSTKSITAKIIFLKLSSLYIGCIYLIFTDAAARDNVLTKQRGVSYATAFSVHISILIIPITANIESDTIESTNSTTIKISKYFFTLMSSVMSNRPHSCI